MTRYKEDGMPWNGRTREEALDNFLSGVEDWKCNICGDTSLIKGEGLINQHMKHGGTKVKAVICKNNHIQFYPVPREDGTWA